MSTFDPGAAYGYDTNSLMSNPSATTGGSGTVYLGPNTKSTSTRQGKGPYAPTFQGKGPYAPGYRPGYTEDQGDTSYLGHDELPYEQARMIPLGWDEKQTRDFVNKGILYKLPQFSADMGMPEIMSAWDDLVQQSQAFSQPGSPWSPYDVLESYNKKPGSFGTIKDAEGNWILDARTGERIKYIGPRSKTETAKRVNLSSPEDVKALTTQMLTELLGRTPTPEELGNYKSAMGSFEAAHPETATTTTSINEKGVETGTSTVSSGGVSDAARQQLITDQAKQGPEYGKYQAATTYWNAFMQMIGG